MGRQRKAATPAKRGQRPARLVAAAFGVLLAAAGWLYVAAPDGEGSRPAALATAGTPVQVIARRETRPTLDPARFVGKARAAHQVAREIPEVLDQLYCYCECDKHAGHRSLLSCYTDGHAAT